MIYNNGKQYGGVNVKNFTAAPDYERMTDVLSDTAHLDSEQMIHRPQDNGFYLLEVQLEVSNITKIEITAGQSKTDVSKTIFSRVMNQFQYSETFEIPVMAGWYYKYKTTGSGRPMLKSWNFIPYSSNIPIKLTETINLAGDKAKVDALPTIDKNNLVNLLAIDTEGNVHVVDPLALQNLAKTIGVFPAYDQVPSFRKDGDESYDTNLYPCFDAWYVPVETAQTGRIAGIDLWQEPLENSDSNNLKGQYFQIGLQRNSATPTDITLVVRHRTVSADRKTSIDSGWLNIGQLIPNKSITAAKMADNSVNLNSTVVTGTLQAKNGGLDMSKLNV